LPHFSAPHALPMPGFPPQAAWLRGGQEPPLPLCQLTFLPPRSVVLQVFPFILNLPQADIASTLVWFSSCNINHHPLFLVGLRYPHSMPYLTLPFGGLGRPTHKPAFSPGTNFRLPACWDGCLCTLADRHLCARRYAPGHPAYMAARLLHSCCMVPPEKRTPAANHRRQRTRLEHRYRTLLSSEGQHTCAQQNRRRLPDF